MKDNLYHPGKALDQFFEVPTVKSSIESSFVTGEVKNKNITISTILVSSIFTQESVNS